MNAILRGAISGVCATVPMTVPIITARRIGLIGTAPPVQISANIAARTPLLPKRRHEGFPATWIAAHFGYGAACGTVYALVTPALPRRPAAKGLIFGALVWAVSYLGYLPAMKLYPAPDDDAPPRTAVMIAAHAVFGLALGHTEQWLRSRR
ncbi:MAG: hypothetical protein H0V37_01765 [Chloroflexia bacterium]|jgi:hypothetical protein|nr:hypothetical protein [Chloroflexia bacterium]